MPKVFDHTPVTFFKTYSANCARRAVMLPIVFPLSKEGGDAREDPGSSFKLFVEQWRKRVDVLSHVGWKALTPGGDQKHKQNNYTLLRNCPPFGVTSKRFSYRCNHARICPMCYGRLIVEPIYGAVEYAWYAGGKDHVLADNTQLVAIKYERDVPLARHPVAERMAYIRKNMYFDADHMQNLGAISLATLSPGRDAEGNFSPDYLCFRRSTILCTRNDASLAEVKATEAITVKTIGSAELTKKDICRQVAWAARYPVGMMYGDAKLATQIYDTAAASRMKSFSASGIFRAG